MASREQGINGSTPGIGAHLKEVRKAKGLSARAVAIRAGISPSVLSRLEADQSSPTLSTLIRVTDALGESMSKIFDDRDTRGPVVRAVDRRRVSSQGATDSLLSPSRDGRLEVIEMTAEPHAVSGPQYNHWGEEECVIVLEGQFEMTLGSDKHLLDVGDSITFSCRTLHGWKNPTDEPVRVLWVLTPGSG